MKLGLCPLGTPVVTQLDERSVIRWRGMGFSCLGGRLPDDLDSIDEANCRQARAMLADNGLELAQVWIFEVPLFHPDPAKATLNQRRLRRALALIRALDCPVLVVGGGSYNPAGAFTPHALNQTEQAVDEVIRCARQVIPAAEDAGAYLAVEPLSLAILRTPQRMRRLIDEVGSGRLGVNLDPVNWMTLDNVYYMTDAVNEMFDLLGEHVVSAHAKDGYIENRVLIHLSECRCGTGQMDWRTFLRRFAQLAPWKAVLLEHTADEDVPAAVKHLQECASAEGLAFD